MNAREGRRTKVLSCLFLVWSNWNQKLVKGVILILGCLGVGNLDGLNISHLGFSAITPFGIFLLGFQYHPLSVVTKKKKINDIVRQTEKERRGGGILTIYCTWKTWREPTHQESGRLSWRKLETRECSQSSRDRRPEVGSSRSWTQRSRWQSAGSCSATTSKTTVSFTPTHRLHGHPNLCQSENQELGDRIGLIELGIGLHQALHPHRPPEDLVNEDQDDEVHKADRGLEVQAKGEQHLRIRSGVRIRVVIIRQDEWDHRKGEGKGDVHPKEGRPDSPISVEIRNPVDVNLQIWQGPRH